MSTIPYTPVVSLTDAVDTRLAQHVGSIPSRTAMKGVLNAITLITEVIISPFTSLAMDVSRSRSAARNSYPHSRGN